MPELKLTIELVPQSLWSQSLYHHLSRGGWDLIRRAVLSAYDNCCGVCGAGGRMICHEIWQYDDVNHRQHLVDLIALCDMCNAVKHLGRTEILARDGRVNLDAVIDHFCRVNSVPPEEYTKARMAAFYQWNERNKYEWTQNFGRYSHLIR